MSRFAPELQERHFERPTSLTVFYDVRDDATQHGLLDTEPKHVYKNFQTPLTYTLKRLARMFSWQEDWDGEGSAKPNALSIIRAKRWIRQMQADATGTGKGWEEPHTTPDENGDVAFEWWHNDRSLVVYVSSNMVDYLKVWGPDIESQMADGVIDVREDNKNLWLWLMD